MYNVRVAVCVILCEIFIYPGFQRFVKALNDSALYVGVVSHMIIISLDTAGRLH